MSNGWANLAFNFIIPRTSSLVIITSSTQSERRIRLIDINLTKELNCESQRREKIKRTNYIRRSLKPSMMSLFEII